MRIDVSLMLTAADDAAPYEACGVVLGDGTVVSIKNLATRPGIFIMDTEELIAVYDMYGDIYGVWHSHPSGNPLPSEEDIEAHPEGKVMFIVCDGKVVNYGRVDGSHTVAGISESAVHV